MSNLEIIPEAVEEKRVALPDAPPQPTPPAARPARPWKAFHKVLFRIAFIFFVSISVPNSLDWYDQVLHIDWTNLHYRDLYDIARFGSGINWFGNRLFGSTLLGYANWIITLLVSVAGGLVWTVIDRRRKPERREYNRLYYWLRVIVRYRAGIGIIGFGFTKLFPVQMPYPSIGLLNTHFGDFTAQKLYWMSVGIVPWYQIFAGVVEVLAGTLLLFRATTTWGAILLLGALGDIVYVNFAYDGGVHVYSSYFVLLSAFLLIPDVPRFYNLLVLERPVVPFNYYPVFSEKWQRYGRVGLKAVTLYVFLALFFYLQYLNWRYDPYKQPSTKGVAQLRGLYDVTEFRLNNQVIPYSPLDTVRWQQATFEKWTTLTFKVNKPTPLDLSNGGGDPQRDINRTFEVSGTAGGQRIFHYYADPVNQVLYLQDKYKAVPDRRNRAAGVGGDGGTEANLNGGKKSLGVGKFRGLSVSEAHLNGGKKPGASLAAVEKEQKASVAEWIPPAARVHIGDEVTQIDPRAASTRRNREFAQAPANEKRNRMVLKYTTQDGSRVVLSGINENRDSIHVVLDRVDRKYALTGSKLSAGQY